MRGIRITQPARRDIARIRRRSGTEFGDQADVRGNPAVSSPSMSTIRSPSTWPACSIAPDHCSVDSAMSTVSPLRNHETIFPEHT